MRDGYIPKEQRKNILLLSDDFRMPSGVGVMSREIVLGTAHRYNWIQVGAAVVHPEAGRVLDASEAIAQETGIPDPYVRIYPYNGYGDANLIRTLVVNERIHGILHFTDPRYWVWLYQIEHELREHVPLMFYHIWDDLPYPKYNENYYRSCDFIASISKQTHNIVRQVWKHGKDHKEVQDWQFKYIPHGINSSIFYKTTEMQDALRQEELKKRLFGDKPVDFVVLYNNRNIRRKMTGDVILAFKEFFKALPEAKRKSVHLLLHTTPVDENGTDLPAVIRDVAPEINATFSEARVDNQTLNDIYNISDVIINLASNEGFGLATAEAVMAEKMILVNVTGGLQDQCGFVDENGSYVHEDIHFCTEWGSNHDGKYRQHGEWAEVCFPTQRALIGSPPTPYIFDDRCSWEDAGQKLLKIYNLPKEERERRGAVGREFMLNHGFSSEEMCKRFMDGIDGTFQHWKPRKRFVLERA